MVYLTFNGKFISYQGGLMTSSVNSFPSEPEAPPTPPPTGPEWSGITVTNGLEIYLDAGASASYGGTGTTWSDLTANNNDFTATNGPVIAADPSSTVFSSFDFDGVNDFFNAGDVGDIGTTDVMVAFWIKADTVSPTYQYVQSKSATGNTASRFGCGLNQAAPFWFIMTNDPSDGTMIWTSNTNISVNTWVYLAFATDRANSQVDFWINGSSVATTRNAAGADLDRTEGDNINSTFDYLLGGTSDGRGSIQLPFNGHIAELHHYTRAISSAEVLSNYNATKAKYGH